jgi:hypothetical protein
MPAPTSNNPTAGQDGWIDDQDEAWVYVSATSFKIVGRDVTTKYTTGTRIKCSNGGSTVYFVVVSSAFSSDTTVTVTGGSDYTLANSSITQNFHSYAENPQGYPGTFAFSSGVTGYGSTSTNHAYFSVSGRTCHVYYRISGTSNSTSKTVALPINSAKSSDFLPQQVANIGNPGQTNQCGNAFCSAAGTLTIVADAVGSTAWTSSGTATFTVGLTYEI